MIPLTILFAAPFALIADPTLLLMATSAALALLLARYHTKPDLIYPALMIAIGVVWEHTGVWSGQWSYPGDPIGGVPLWSSVLWAGVGLSATASAAQRSHSVSCLPTPVSCFFRQSSDLLHGCSAGSRAPWPQWAAWSAVQTRS